MTETITEILERTVDMAKQIKKAVTMVKGFKMWIFEKFES